MARAVRKRTRAVKKAEGERLKVKGPVRSKYWRKVHEVPPETDAPKPENTPAKILGYKPPAEKKPGVMQELIRQRLREKRSFHKIQDEISRKHQVDGDDIFREIIRQYGRLAQEDQAA